MTSNRPEALSKLTSRQKMIGIIFAVVILIILWEVIGMFTGRKSTPTQPVTTRQATAMNAGVPGGLPAQPMTPRPAPLPKQQTALSPQEIALQQIQQESEKNYVTALNQLQMLRVQKDIAETNKAIMAAKLDTVTSEKKVVDLLAPPAPHPTPATYAQGLVNPAQVGGPPIISPSQTEANYTVISVSQLQHKWAAVIGYQGNLYSVSVGDVLPVDRSIVLHIDKSGVILEKNGVKKKFSLVPII
jgi:hypothetical protein